MRRPVAIALVSGILASFAVSTTAFTQAGSTGGTLGKQDKSLSGERDEQTPAQSESPATPKTSRRPTVPKETGCQKIIGKWTWQFPTRTTETVFNADGTATNSSG